MARQSGLGIEQYRFRERALKHLRSMWLAARVEIIVSLPRIS